MLLRGQFLRQRTKIIAGIVMIALAVTVLGVCVGQSLAAQKTREELEYRFTTIALPTSNYNLKYLPAWDMMGVRPTMNEEVAAWVDEVIEAHPELVETVSHPLLASAYIPDLVPDHYQNHGYQLYYGQQSFAYGNNNTDRMLPQNDVSAFVSNYDTAMLVVTLKEIGDVTEITYPMTLNPVDPATGKQEKIAPLYQYQLTLKGTIERVVSLAEELPDFSGMPIELNVVLPATQSVDDLKLETGQQYIVYGLNYYDHSNDVSAIMGFPVSDPEQFHVLTPEQQARFRELYTQMDAPYAIYGDLSILEERIDILEWRCAPISYEWLERGKYVTMSVYDFAAMPQFSYDDGAMLQTRDVTEGYEVVSISWEKYMERYSIPTIARLDGSVEDFLAENELWKDTLEYSAVNNHAFPVIGVEKLGYIADFARDLTRVTQGREFTREELESGAKVCIISETLAQMNGLRVGDTIDPQFYDSGRNIPYQSYLFAGEGTVYPNAYYFTAQAVMEEPEKFTIIGLYRQDYEWADAYENNHTFSPNTIFVPEGSITTTMYYGTQGMFETLILKNGCIEAFDAIVLDKEFETMKPYEGREEMFIYYDQGYSEVMESFHNFEELGRKVLTVGVSVYAIILLLFLLLYPARQGKTLRTMGSLGAGRKEKLGYVLGSSSAILLPGTVLGAALTLALWGPVVSRLLTAGGASFSLSLDLGTLAAVAGAQLFAALLLVLLLAIPMTRNSSLMKRK